MSLNLYHIVSEDVLKYKTDADIKEGIRLDKFTMFTFTPYYDHSPPLWEVVNNSMSSLWKFTNYHKGCISKLVSSLLSN